MVSAFLPDLKGRTVLVTGASRGIGRAIALAFVRAGARVCACARTLAALTPLQSELADAHASGLLPAGATAALLPLAADVANEDAVAQLKDEVTKALGPLEIVVNNAGVFHSHPVDGYPLPEWHQVLETNLTGSMLVSRAFLPEMVSAGWGRIVNISSISGRTGEAFASAYSASKFGLVGFTQALALEVARHGITANAVCPGWVATDMSLSQLEDEDWCRLNSIAQEDSQEIARLSVPQMRFIEPDEVASLTLYLASEAARGITGQSINICGGLSLH